MPEEFFEEVKLKEAEHLHCCPSFYFIRDTIVRLNDIVQFKKVLQRRCAHTRILRPQLCHSQSALLHDGDGSRASNTASLSRAHILCALVDHSGRRLPNTDLKKGTQVSMTLTFIPIWAATIITRREMRTFRKAALSH
jgi:hypothetical protein